jgi:membrane associated rhomboid family serine protease
MGGGSQHRRVRVLDTAGRPAVLLDGVPQHRQHRSCILDLVPRSAAFLIGIVAFVAFAGLYAVSWIAAFGFLALWLAATVLYRRHQRR